MTAPDVNVDVRAKFEAEFSKPPFEFSMTRFGASSAWPGNYRGYSVQCAWEGYRAAHADLSGEVRELVEALKLARDYAAYVQGEPEDLAVMDAALPNANGKEG